MAGNDGAVGEEEDPDSVPAFTIFVYDLGRVTSASHGYREDGQDKREGGKTDTPPCGC